MKLLIVAVAAILGSVFVWPLAIFGMQKADFPPKATAIVIGSLIAALVCFAQRIHFRWHDLAKVWLAVQILLVGVVMHHLPADAIEKLIFFVASHILIVRMILDLGSDIRELAESNINPANWYSPTFLITAALSLIGQVWWLSFLMHDGSLTWETVWKVWGNIMQPVGVVLIIVGLTYGRTPRRTES